MFNKKHLENLQKEEAHAREKRLIVEFSTFFISLLLLGPLIHEASHIATLEFLGCSYSTNIGFGLQGLFASVQPLCSLKPLPLSTFYASGYTLTLISGAALSYSGFKRLKEDRNRYLIRLMIGLGIITSIIPSISFRGDVTNLVKVLALPESYIFVLTGFGFLIASTIVLKILTTFWDTSERE